MAKILNAPLLCEVGTLISRDFVVVVCEFSVVLVLACDKEIILPGISQLMWIGKRFKKTDGVEFFRPLV